MWLSLDRNASTIVRKFVGLLRFDKLPDLMKFEMNHRVVSPFDMRGQPKMFQYNKFSVDYTFDLLVDRSLQVCVMQLPCPCVTCVCIDYYEYQYLAIPG